MELNVFLCSQILLLLISSSSSEVILKDNGYEGVVVALEDNLPVKYCQEILLGLEVILLVKYQACK